MKKDRIREAARAYANSCPTYGDAVIARSAFAKGAEWMKNETLPWTWHDAADKPEGGRWIIVEIWGRVYKAMLAERGWTAYVRYNGVLRWCYIDIQ